MNTSREGKTMHSFKKFLEEESKNEILKNLKLQYENSLQDMIKRNNIKNFNQIKFILRNFLMSLVWAYAFFKLSRIIS